MVGLFDYNQGEDVEMDDGSKQMKTGKKMIVGSAELNFKRDRMEI